MENIILKTLNLKDKNIIFDEKLDLEVFKDKLSYFYYAKLMYSPETCPCCDCDNVDYRIIKTGTKLSRISLPKVSERPTYLMLRKQRFYCKACERYFTAETPEVDKHCFISNNSRMAMIDKATQIRSELSIAKSCSVSSTTVSRMIDRAAHALYQSPYAALPEHLMMDEFKSVKHVSGHMSFIYADAETHRIVDVVEDRRLKSLKQYFYRFSLKDRQNVKTVSIDMHESYMTLIKELFPNAKIIIDRFHIIQLLNRSLNRVRVSTMNDMKNINRPLYNKYKRYWKLLLTPIEDLNVFEYNKIPLFKKWQTQKGIVHYLLDQDEALKDTHQIINQLRYHLKYNDLNGFIEILTSVNLSDVHQTLKPAIRTLKRHMGFIQNTFSYINLSNGPLEGINNKVKLIKRTSFGYRNYDHLRNRILLCSKLYAPTFKKEVKQNLVA